MTIDDSTIVRELIKKALGNGYNILEAEDGMQALEVVEKQEEIHLIICDVNMPRMDGLTFVEKFRQKSQFQKVPIMMLTTEATPHMKTHARRIGVTAWMLKPFTNDKMIKAVEKIIL